MHLLGNAMKYFGFLIEQVLKSGYVFWEKTPEANTASHNDHVYKALSVTVGGIARRHQLKPYTVQLPEAQITQYHHFFILSLTKENVEHTSSISISFFLHL